MTVYAIGDVQGCYDDLLSLLDIVRFDGEADTLWFVGDLVNRGRQSLQTLRFVKSLGNSAITVLGNHDLHLLAVDAGYKSDKHGDLAEILRAPDRRELINWLRNRPLMHHDEITGYTLVHAGLSPQWDFTTARLCAEELQTVLRSENYYEFLEVMYGDEPLKWVWSLRGWDRLRYICNCFTRIRYCNSDGMLALTQKGAPEDQVEGLVPWFDVADRLNHDMKIIFGHWSTLGKHHQAGIYALDTGCVWGGSLTAMEVGTEPAIYHQVSCPGAQNPHDFI